MLTELFTSRTRIRVLLKLFLNPDISSYLRELSAEFEVSPSALKGELDSLNKAGYLTKTKKGRSIFFRANTKHPFFAEIHSIVKKSLGIDRVIDEVRGELGDVESVYILDDYARGVDSGLIDILIIGDVSEKRLHNYVLITEKKINRKLRVLVITKEDFVTHSQMYLKRPHWRVI